MIGYSAGVSRALILSLAPLLSLACAAGPERPAPVATEAASVAPPPPPVKVTACRAEPSTVYGEEPVLFRVEGVAAAGASVAVALLAQRQQRVAQGSVQVPGQWTAPVVPSGDFTLKVGSSDVSCRVTVNRELPRASSAAR